MKIEKKDLIKYIIIGVIVLFVFILIIVLITNNKDDNKINFNKVSDNHVVEDSMVMTLYERYNPETELMFNLIGSDINKDYYGYFYKSDKIKYKDLDDVVRSTILFDDADYKTGEYNEENRCYYMSKDTFSVIYKKIFGKDDYNIDFGEKFNPVVYDEGDSICIGEVNSGNYKNVIDTYMINAINKGDYITIYERVAFVEIGDKYLYFYKDIKKKDLVYKLEITGKTDMGFINDYTKVSNVLLKYQNEFDLYEYTYKKGEDSYYFESIKK